MGSIPTTTMGPTGLLIQQGGLIYMRINSKKDIVSVALEAEIRRGTVTVMAVAEKEVGCNSLLLEITLLDSCHDKTAICYAGIVTDLAFTEEALTAYILCFVEQHGDSLEETFYNLTTSEIAVEHETEVKKGIQTDKFTLDIPFSIIGYDITNELDLWGADWMNAYLDTDNHVLTVTYEHDIPVA
ncbi:MAG: hypothetical protein VB095_11085 [Anaerovorax sp.]|nr:hypothetical protein [Anaerovorax sp.]